MEILKDKYKDLDEIFWRDYIHVGDSEKMGTNIPCESIHRDSKNKHMGDGTINLAQLMTYLYFCEKNGEKKPITLIDCVRTLFRLSDSAKKFYDPVLPCKDEDYTEFFLRDDCDQEDVAWGSWKMLHGKNVDPCHSPFVSQDQVWNLSPILAALGRELKNYQPEDGNDYYARFGASDFGEMINSGIMYNGYKVINPYLTKLIHLNTYLPSFKLSVVDRRLDVNRKVPKPVKVKRGANNWYYSGGTQACVEAFKDMNDYLIERQKTLRKALYKGIVFFLDRVYEPIYKRFTGKDFKHNSYYCYAATSGIWYDSKFKERFVSRFVESLDEWSTRNDEKVIELFEPNIAPLVIDDKESWKKCEENLFDWLYWYSQKVEGNSVYSPLEALTLYEWYKYMYNLK